MSQKGYQEKTITSLKGTDMSSQMYLINSEFYIHLIHKDFFPLKKKTNKQKQNSSSSPFLSHKMYLEERLLQIKYGREFHVLNSLSGYLPRKEHIKNSEKFQSKEIRFCFNILPKCLVLKPPFLCSLYKSPIIIVYLEYHGRFRIY